MILAKSLRFFFSPMLAICTLSFDPRICIGSQLNKETISLKEIDQVQQRWCDGLLEISKEYRDGGNYKEAASKFIDQLYDYTDGQVFFRPTMASGKNAFRPTREGALSYFIGGNPHFPEDRGFALNHWTACSYDNNASENGFQIHGDIAITMGNVYLTDVFGKTTTVDKTFVFRKCADGVLRLCVHKSALANAPAS